MSKTDKTKPIRVQIAENPVAVHDHVDGPCDLPPIEAYFGMPKRQAWRLRCHWDAKDWHKITFSRSKGEKFWAQEDRQRKEKARRERPAWMLEPEDEPEFIPEGCDFCCGGFGR